VIALGGAVPGAREVRSMRQRTPVAGVPSGIVGAVALSRVRHSCWAPRPTGNRDVPGRPLPCRERRRVDPPARSRW
jgi:hypothetical protein